MVLRQWQIMTVPKGPITQDELRELSDQVNQLVKDAFEAGYRAGLEAAKRVPQ